ncbi:hypothetical protein MKW94_009960, partial [Papaver nudicaule]|nr:hypothetical protein [Papaver nudicaule]
MMQYQQPPQQQIYAYGAPPPQTAAEGRTLWIGDLEDWMDECYIHACFAHTGEVHDVKVIRNMATGQSEGYGLIEFSRPDVAARILQTYNGQLMPHSEQNFRLNWPSIDDSPDFTVFVGGLAHDVTDYVLQETFKTHYTSVKGAKVVTDRTTGDSKAYRFVRFADEGEQMRAMAEMDLLDLLMKANKKTAGVGQQRHPKELYLLKPSLVNAGLFGGLVSKRKQLKQYALSLEGEYSNQG